jgi:DNA-binding transcriptional MerR regulator
MKIGRVADATGLSIDALRFYERRGLIAKPRRTVSGYRVYSDGVLDQLRFIQDAKRLGFSLREVRELLSLGVKSTAECGPVTRKAEAKLAEMREEINRLQQLKRTLEKMVKDCGGCSSSHCARCRSTRALNGRLKIARTGKTDSAIIKARLNGSRNLH